MKKLIAILVVLILVTGCGSLPTGSDVAIDSVKKLASDDLPMAVAKLPKMNLSSVDSFERYKTFADSMNGLINILNGKNDLFDIPLIQATWEGWEKASKTITEYGPLMNNYDETVTSAKDFEADPNEENLKKFYMASGKFAFETGLIVWAVFYSAAFKAVGFVYRAVGLNSLAFKCGPCVSFILSNAHWAVRGALVEGASLAAENLANAASKVYEAVGGAEGIKQKALFWIEVGKEFLDAKPNNN